MDDELPEPILLIESDPDVYKFTPAIKAKNHLKIIKEDPIKKCKLNTKKIYKLYEDEQQLKSQVDVLKAAIREIKAAKSVNFNKDAGLKRLDAASTH